MSGPSSPSIAPRAIGWRSEVRRVWPGVLLSVVIAIAAAFIADHRGGPTLLYALLLGMALNAVAVEGIAKPGVDFAARSILRFGVALLGARITVDQIGGLGWYNGGLIVAGVALTIGFGWAAARTLGLSRRIGLLTGGATAICGASAAIAIATVLPRDEKSERELIFTIAGVTALSTIAMILYPVIVGVAGLDPRQAGIFLGGTIHDVAQVVGAGYSVSPEVGDYAVLTKMLRVALLLPVVMAFSLAVRHHLQGTGERGSNPLLPPFLLVFIAFVGSTWRKPVHLFVVCGLAMIHATAVPAAEVTGRVIQVDTGDTLNLVTDDKREITVRLSDIGAPVGSAFYAPAARQLLANMVLGETVRVEVTGQDGPAHIFGRAYRGLLDVNLELVKAGAAWMCIEFARDTDYLPYENQAIRRRLGVWSRTTAFDARLACRARPPAPKRQSRISTTCGGGGTFAFPPATSLLCDT